MYAIKTRWKFTEIFEVKVAAFSVLSLIFRIYLQIKFQLNQFGLKRLLIDRCKSYPAACIKTHHLYKWPSCNRFKEGPTFYFRRLIRRLKRFKLKLRLMSGKNPLREGGLFFLGRNPRICPLKTDRLDLAAPQGRPFYLSPGAGDNLSERTKNGVHRWLLIGPMSSKRAKNKMKKKNGTRRSESDRLAPTLGCLFALKANGKWSAARRHQRMSVRTKVAEKKVKILLCSSPISSKSLEIAFRLIQSFLKQLNWF